MMTQPSASTTWNCLMSTQVKTSRSCLLGSKRIPTTFSRMVSPKSLSLCLLPRRKPQAIRQGSSVQVLAALSKSNSQMDLLSQLNEQQREAVTSADGPLLILAGAGSGKTRVIAHRITYLIAERGIWPRNILAVTFTNKAAEEMRNRVNRILEGLELGSVPLISTFHSLCVRVLRRDIEALNAGYSRSFTIYDQDDAVRLTRNCIRDLGMDDKQLTPRSVQAAISSAKNRGEDAESFAARAHFIDERRASIARVFQLYEERLHKNNALDFDDLLIKAVRLLRDVPEVRERYNDRFRYLLVDEYQDTNQ